MYLYSSKVQTLWFGLTGPKNGWNGYKDYYRKISKLKSHFYFSLSYFHSFLAMGAVNLSCYCLVVDLLSVKFLLESISSYWL